MKLEKKFIWIIGCPRSGTTMLTEYVGKYTDCCYVEPWSTHPRNNFSSWEFSDCDSVVFKYCSNWALAKKIQKKFKNSFFIHLLRNPKDVVYSMVFPKKKSYPQRHFTIFSDDLQSRFNQVANHWYEFTKGCFEIKNYVNYKLFIYEKTPKEIKKIEKFLNLKFKHDIKFKSRNTIAPNVYSDCLETFWKNNSKFYNFRKKIEEKYYYIKFL